MCISVKFVQQHSEIQYYVSLILGADKSSQNIKKKWVECTPIMTPQGGNIDSNQIHFDTSFNRSYCATS